MTLSHLGMSHLVAKLLVGEMLHSFCRRPSTVTGSAGGSV
jgi:hypothetical protein